MWKVRNNIDLVQINLDNADGKFYLPENVDFRDKIIEEIFIVADYNRKGLIDGTFVGSGVVGRSPFDGRELATAEQFSNFYLELINDERKVFFDQVSALSCNAYQNAPFPINSKISLKLSNLRYTGNDDLTGKCVLLYVCYDSEFEEEAAELPQNSVSKIITIPAGTNSILLSGYIDDYIRRIGGRVKAIETDTTAPYYLDLATRNKRVFRMVASQLFDSYKRASHSQPLLLGDFDVDFRNSRIYPAQTENATNILLTFYY